MSYDLRLLPRGGLDLQAARDALEGVEGIEGDGNELVWARESLVAQFLLAPGEVDVGVVSGLVDDARVRANEFRELLELLLDLARRLGAEVHDTQLGRTLGPADLDEAVAGFA